MCLININNKKKKVSKNKLPVDSVGEKTDL